MLNYVDTDHKIKEFFIMNLKKLIFTLCDSYRANIKMDPKGVMVHSTAANNPNLKRYVGPDDGLLGVNKNKNYWNRPKVGKSVHAFIGKLADGSVASYQVLPWNIKAGHAGKGKKGSANDTHIAFEICEDNLKDAKYFAAVYKEAVELTAMLCKEYKLDPLKDGVVICHCEGHKRGIASNHGDVMHWFPKHGKSMDTFRADVNNIVNPPKPVVKEEKEPAKPKVVKDKTVIDTAEAFSKTLKGTYQVKSSIGLNVRVGAGTSKKKILKIKNKTKVTCYGYYSSVKSKKWLLIQFEYNGVQYTGFASSTYLKKV